LSTQEAWDHIRAAQSLSINGSGNNFENGIKNGMEMAREMNLDISVHYYMPQKADYLEYETASNNNLRTALHYIFEQSRNTSTVINVQTHSWSGFVVSTSCNNDCINVNHISYTPATSLLRQTSLMSGYQYWLGRAHVIWSKKDMLSHYTHASTLLISPPNNVESIEVNSGHPLSEVLQARNWRTYWRENSLDP
jgi:hypothetical protein